MEKKLRVRREFFNPVFKDSAKVLTTSEETGGAFMVGELTISPGGGNFMHTHSAFEETFTAVKGILGVGVNDKKYFLSPGNPSPFRFTPHIIFLMIVKSWLPAI